MATDIPQHNLNEVCDATIAYIENNSISTKELVGILQCPDVPMGGLFCKDNYEETYESGNGTFKWRANIAFEEDGKNKSIVVKSLPMASNSTDIICEIVKGVNEDKIDGVVEVRDESTKEGLRICIDLANNADCDAVMSSIYSNTKLQSVVKYNSVVLLDNQPKCLGLKDVLGGFVEFRRGIVKTRAIKRKEKFVLRKEIVDGVLKINPKKVISVVISGLGSEEIKKKLMSDIGLTYRQADYIFNMPIRKLSKTDKDKLLEEQKELDCDIKEQENIINNISVIDDIIKKDLMEIRNEFGLTRKTQVVDEPVVKEEDVFLSFFSDGTVKATSSEKKKSFKKNPVFVSNVFSTHDEVEVFTNKGRKHTLSVCDVGFSKTEINKIISEYEDEKVVSVEKKRDGDFVALTIGSVGKIRLLHSESINGKTDFYPVDTGGEVINTLFVEGKEDVVVVTKKGRVLRLSLNDVSVVRSRGSAGVSGIKLRDGDEIISLSVVDDEESSVVTISEDGYAKITPISEFSVKGRGGIGVAGTSKDNLVFGQVVGKDDNLSVLTSSDCFVIVCRQVSQQGRATKGSLLRKKRQEDSVVSVYVE
jgi:DNA gyrase subunit A